ncbi:MAG TPA: CoA transferase, partial [Chromatiales bacterium]|nr:CoA transferase [Chromatiales bacterium]
APEMLEDAQFKARQAIITTLHPKFGELKMQNVAPKLSSTPGGVRSAAPELGQHNEEVYRQLLNYSEERIEQLREAGII